LFKIRNPWGAEKYTGQYNDDDTIWDSWDADLLTQVGYVDADDGSFFLDAATYHAEFESTSIHVDTTNMKQSYFLVTNDDTARTA